MKQSPRTSSSTPSLFLCLSLLSIFSFPSKNPGVSIIIYKHVYIEDKGVSTWVISELRNEHCFREQLGPDGCTLTIDYVHICVGGLVLEVLIDEFWYPLDFCIRESAIAVITCSVQAILLPYLVVLHQSGGIFGDAGLYSCPLCNIYMMMKEWSDKTFADHNLLLCNGEPGASSCVLKCRLIDLCVCIYITAKHSCCQVIYRYQYYTPVCSPAA